MQETEKIIEAFDDKAATQLMEKILFSLNPITMQEDYENNTLSLTKEVVELNERKAFLEGVADYLEIDDVADTEAMLSEVKNRYDKKGIRISKAVKGWFQKQDISPSTDQAYRRNLYEFCYALDMDVQMTAEFFLKSFLTVPFNYKDKDDAVYLYCMKNQKKYATVRRLLDEADKFDATNTEVSNTEQIGRQILDIETDEEFLNYLQSHCYDRKHQYSAAKQKIIECIEQNKKIVPQNYYDEFNNLGTKKNSTLLEAILGYRYQGLDKQQRQHMKDCGLPTLPRDGDIGKMTSPENEVSFDILRKT